MNAITETLEKNGAKVSRATWNGRATAAEFAEDVKKMNDEGANIRYSVFSKGTVFPEGQEGGMEHMQTWKVAYYVEGVRDWIFSQSK
jgi:predicted peptidase